MKVSNTVPASLKKPIKFVASLGALFLILSATFGTNAATFPFMDSIKGLFSDAETQNTEIKQQGEPLLGSSLSFNGFLDPSTIGPGSISTLTYNITNNSSNPTTDIALTVTLPASVTIANVPNANSTISNGMLTAPAGGSTITFSDGDLAGSTSGTISVDVTSSTPGTHTITSGTLTSSTGSSGTVSDDLTVATNRPGFSMSFSPNSVNLGERSTITYTIDNSANASALSSVSFTNVLPEGLVIASPANAVSTLGGPNPNLVAMPGTDTISVSSFGILFPGFEVMLAGETATVTVDVVATASGNLDNTTSQLTTNAGSSGKASDTLNVTADTVGIQMDFTDDPTPPGGTSNLEFTINNRDRNNAATNLAFTLDLDSIVSGAVATGLPQTNTVGTGSTISGTSIITLTGGSVPAGGSATFSIPIQLPAGATAGNFDFTTSSLTGDLGGNAFTSSPASDTLFIQAAPILEMSYIDDPISPGDITSLEFTITNTNTTNSATDIAFNTSLPVIIPTADNVPSPVCNGGTLSFSQLVAPPPPSNVIPSMITLNNATLAAGASCTFTVDLNTDANAPGGTYPTMSGNITATVDGDSVSGQPAADILEVITVPSLAMTFADPVVPGSTTTLDFTLQYGENASADATNVGFTVDLNSALVGLTATGLPQNNICGTGSQASGTGVITFSGGTLSPGGSCTFSVTVQVPANAPAGSFPVTTSDVAATISGGSVTRQGVSDNLDVSPLVTTAEFIDSPTVSGDLLTLRFTFDNQGTSDATNIFFTASLSTVISGMVAEAPLPTNPCGAGSSISGTSFLIFVGGNVTAGNSCTFDVMVRIPASAAIGNYSLATSNVTATIDGNNVVLAPMTAQFEIIQPLSVATNFVDTIASVGDTTTLEFTITNSSTTDSISGISFTDNLNASLSGLSAIGLPANNICGAGSQISGTTNLSFTGGSLAPGASCTFSVTLQVPAGASTGTITNTTSNPNGQLNGLAITGTAIGDSINIINDVDNPTISYTPVSSTNSTADQLVRVSISDGTGIADASISYSINGGTFTNSPCNLTSGTAQNGEWVCPISGITSPSTVTYFVTATDLVSKVSNNPIGAASIPNLFTVGAGVVPAGNYTNGSFANGTTFSGDVRITNNLDLGGIIDAGNNTVTLNCNATATGGGVGNYLIGNLAKEFCTASVFTYPVGTAVDGSIRSFIGASEYSPLTANVTSAGISPSTLTVSVVDGFLPGSGTSQSASRYWDIDETGDITADISFTYLNQDVNGDESNYQVLRLENTTAEVFAGGSVNPSTNTATASNVSEFSRWAAGNLAPTAAGVEIGGRVLNTSGRGIARTRVMLTDLNGNVSIRQTNPFGYYRFSDITAGETYILTVQDKSYSFEQNSRTIFAGEDNLNVNFTAADRSLKRSSNTVNDRNSKKPSK